MIEISVVSPVYRSARLVQPFVERVTNVLQQLQVNYEIILVDDGCPELSWTQIEAACKQDKNVKGILLSRNFGQHYAITAGLDAAQGDWIVVMDSDLQDKPEEIFALYSKAKEGFEVVLCRRKHRTDGWIKKVTSVLFYGFLSLITGRKIDHAVANYGIYNKKVINAIVRMRETVRYFPMMILWVGFKTATIDVEHGESKERRSGYSMGKLMKLGLDIVLSYSDRPLQIVAMIGGLISLSTVVAGLVILYKYFNNLITVQGYTSLLLSIWFLSGLIIATLGVVGLYVGKTFQGIKQRPLYIASKTLNVVNE